MIIVEKKVQYLKKFQLQKIHLNGLKIEHGNKYETVYCHLSKVTVRKGERVEAGCKVAETGNSGRTTGPHLHYGIKEDGDYVDPQNWVNAKRQCDDFLNFTQKLPLFIGLYEEI